MLSSAGLKRGIKIALLLSFLPILMALSVNDFTTKTAPTYITDAPDGYGVPSPMSKRMGLLVTSTGIIKQVNDNYNITLGDSVNISADGERSLGDVSAGFGSPLRYQWFEASETDKWQSIDPKKTNSKHLSFRPTEKGIYWFQLRMSYSTFWLNHYIYTKVAKVTVTPNRIKVDTITLDTNSDYIYNKKNFFNNNSTYALALVNPDNSTEQVKWSLNQNDGDLAKIDDDGKVTANLVSDQNNKSGEIEIHAAANHNLPETELAHATKKIKIGGGLLDTHVSFGKSALFELQGMENSNRGIDTDDIDIIWQRKKKGADKFKDISSLNKSDSKFSFETSDVSFSDDGDLYQATVKTSINNKEQSYTTNPAKLIVNPTKDYNVDFSVTVEDYFSKDPQNTNHLNNIKSGDQIAYHIVLSNHGKKTIDSSELTLLVPQNTETDPSHILIPDKVTEIKDPTSQLDGDVKKLNFEILSLKPQETRTFDISIRAPIIDKKQTLIFNPTYSYTNMGEKTIIKSPELSFTFVTNRIELHPQSIIFEPITLFEKDVIKHRTSSGTPITVDDQRIDTSKAVTLYLQQTSNFLDRDKKILPFHLFIYDSDGSVKNIKDKTLIATSRPLFPLDSIHWDRDHGLLLHVDNATNLTPGNYSADITWTVKQAP